MFDEILKKFPDIIKMLIQRISETNIPGNFETPERKLAKQKLLSQLNGATEELAKLTDLPGERLTEEQMKQIMSIPRPTQAFLKDKGGAK